VPVVPSKAAGDPASGSRLSATSVPDRKEAAYCHVPVSFGVKCARQAVPLAALVSAALPSAAKYPGTVTSVPEAECVNVTDRR
jgi:hypothetical protein